MAALGPFETAPELAVAVSGGADSMALALLAHTWARQRGGTVTALTVDHGLRP
ncbi:MAG: tRNA lysidine(34) synthetase TilS, partial [Rhodospirillaceae bacterium]|nr:tRNA lysidine(34) synthetase TilS [Rhodospirillaceae bacterium]